MLESTDQLTEKNVNKLLLLISNNSFVKMELEEKEEVTETYQSGFAGGAKAGFNLAIMEMKEAFSMSV